LLPNPNGSFCMLSDIPKFDNNWWMRNSRFIVSHPR
jgi:hypothetical protein